MRKMNWSYLAGFFDGEGYCDCRRYSGHLKSVFTIGQNDKLVLKEIKEFLRMQKIYKVFIYPAKSVGWILQVGNREEVRKILTHLKPICLVKYVQIRETLKNMVPYEKDFSPLDIGWVKVMYKKGLSCGEIANKLSCKRGRIEVIMRKLNMLRSQSEAARLAHLSGRRRLNV